MWCHLNSSHKLSAQELEEVNKHGVILVLLTFAKKLVGRINRAFRGAKKVSEGEKMSPKTRGRICLDMTKTGAENTSRLQVDNKWRRQMYRWRQSGLITPFGRMPPVGRRPRR